MNLDRYEKIDGREAFRQMLDGKEVLDCTGIPYKLENDKLCYSPKVRDFIMSGFTLHDVLIRDWYVPKPFDVRQAMLDRPNEWVGKYSVQDEEKTIWYYVGFDSKNFCALRMKKRNKYGMKEPVKWNGGNVVFAIDDDLDACIPIEDVPEEAKR